MEKKAIKITNDPRKALRRLLSLALVSCVLLFMAPSAAFAASGDVTVDGVTYTYSGSKITKVSPGAETDVTIPETLDGVTVTGLAPGCFADCGSVTTLTLPNTLTNLRPAVFAGLDSLTAIEMEWGDRYFTRDGVLYYSDTSLYGNNQWNSILLFSLVYYPRAKTDTYYMPVMGVGTMERNALVNPYLKTLELPGTYSYWNEDTYSHIDNRSHLDEDLLTADCPNLETLILDAPLIGEEHLDPNAKRVPLPASFLTAEGAGSLSTLCVPRDSLELSGDLDGEKADILIQGVEGSETQTFAEENGFRFQALSESHIISPKIEQNSHAISLRVTGGPAATDYYGAEGIRYSVQNEYKAAVDQNGTVTAKDLGYTVLFAYVPATDDTMPCWSYCSLNLKKGWPNLRVTNATDREIHVKPNAEPFQLDVQADADGLKYTYMSENAAIAAVDTTGLVTLGPDVKGGDCAKITVKSDPTDRYVSESVNLTIVVDRYSQKVSIDGKATRSIAYDKTTTVKGTAKTKVTYATCDSGCAKVNSETGKVTFLHPGTVKIKAKAARSDLYESAEATATITSKLGKPSLKVTRPRKGAAKLTWSKVPGATHYIVYVKKPGAKSYKAAVTKSAKVKSVTHSKLKSGKTYRYRVRAVVKYKGNTYYGPYCDSVKVKVR